MGATTDSNATSARSPTGSELPAFVFDQPFQTVVAATIVLAGGTGLITFAYLTVLSEIGLAPRTDALAIAGILAVLLLVSVSLLSHVRQREAIDRAIATLSEQRSRHTEEIEQLHNQTEDLQQAMELFAEQQSTHRTLYSPSIEIDWFRLADYDGVADVARFTVSNLSFGAALNLTVRSEIELIDPPEEYAISGGRAICPATRNDNQQQSVRIPPYAESLDVDTIVLVDVSEDIDGRQRKHTVTCRFSDAMCVFYEDGVEAVDLSFEIAYEDVFGTEYTERIRVGRIELTENMTLRDVLAPRPEGGDTDRNEE